MTTEQYFTLLYTMLTSNLMSRNLDDFFVVLVPIVIVIFLVGVVAEGKNNLQKAEAV